MRSGRLRLWSLLLIAPAAVACFEDLPVAQDDPGRDAGPDVSLDGSADSSPDVASDVSADAASDADAGSDAAADGPTDAPGDSGSVAPAPVSTKCWRGAGQSCDWTVDKMTFRRVDTGDFTDAEAGNATFSPDACRIYFTSGAYSTSEIAYVERSAPAGTFAPEVRIMGANDPAFTDESPSVTPDGLQLFFVSDRSESKRKVFRSERNDLTEPWGSATEEPALNFDTVVNAWEPRVAPHGLRLYYAPDAVEQQIRMAKRTSFSEPFGDPQLVNIVGKTEGFSTNRPSVSQDERLLVGVQQPPLMGMMREAFYMTRDDWNAPWSAIREVPINFGSGIARDIAVSPDGCEVIVRDYSEAAMFEYVTP